MRKAVVVITFISVLIIGVASANAAYSSHTSLSGGASLKASYQTNRNRSPDDEKDRKELTANASLSLRHSKQGEKGAFLFSTRQTITYNFRTENASFSDFNLFSSGWRDLSSRLNWNFSNSFIRSNDLWGDYSSSSSTRRPGNEEENDQDSPAFSDRSGNRKFWRNSFSTGLNFQYAQNGTFSIGYGNRILEYDESDEDNYKSHSINSGISYRFNGQWSSSLSYRYTDTDYDISEDYTSHDAGFNLGYSHSVWNSFSAGVNYNEKNYDTDSTEIPDDNRNDWYTVSGSLGWTHAFSPTKTLSMSGGLSHVNRDKDDSKTSPNFNVNYTSLFENGSWFVGAAGGLDDRSLDGNVDEGLSEYVRAMTGVSWQVAKKLSANLGASVRDDDYLQDADESDEKTYNANASLHYSFMRWFYLSGRYSYTQVVADDHEDEYKNHYFLITLGTSKELKRWIH